jgi:hypothetical protein
LSAVLPPSGEALCFSRSSTQRFCQRFFQLTMGPFARQSLLQYHRIRPRRFRCQVFWFLTSVQVPRKTNISRIHTRIFFDVSRSFTQQWGLLIMQ